MQEVEARLGETKFWAKVVTVVINQRSKGFPDEQNPNKGLNVQNFCKMAVDIFYNFFWGYDILRRGVRSDAQLSSTETRFQKCSQSGKNGSKHPMLSISMAFNVISCKKVERNTQKLKIADFTM